MVTVTKVLHGLSLDVKTFSSAAALGCNMEFVGTAEKVSNGKIVKDCAEEAIKLNPNDGSAHYILGRFYLELLKVLRLFSNHFSKYFCSL